MPDSPIEPIVDATKKASIHFGKAAFEIFAGVGALANGVVRVVRGDDPPDGDHGPEHIPVE